MNMILVNHLSNLCLTIVYGGSLLDAKNNKLNQLTVFNVNSSPLVTQYQQILESSFKLQNVENHCRIDLVD